LDQTVRHKERFLDAGAVVRADLSPTGSAAPSSTARCGAAELAVAAERAQHRLLVHPVGQRAPAEPVCSASQTLSTRPSGPKLEGDMTSLEVSLDETTAKRLEQAAERLGVSTEELLRLSLQEKLDRLDEAFRSAADYVLDKNSELYRRLA